MAAVKARQQDNSQETAIEVIDPDRIARNLSPDSPQDYSIAAGRQAIKEALNESILDSSERAAVKMRFSPCFKINDLRH